MSKKSNAPSIKYARSSLRTTVERNASSYRIGRISIEQARRMSTHERQWSHASKNSSKAVFSAMPISDHPRKATILVEDDDAIWERLSLEHADALAALAARVIADDDAGLTEPLDLEKL